MICHRANLAGFAVIYVLCFCVALPAFIDEAYIYNLVSDPSLRHMLSALAHGADGTFPVYALFAFGWAKVFGTSELSLRLTGGLFVILFVWHSGGRLLRRFSPTAAGLALLFILATRSFIFYTIQTRFYGLIIFLFSLVFWGSWDLLEDKGLSLGRRLGHGLACGLLCLSHPFGIVYTGLLALLYVAFSNFRKTFSWPNITSFLGGPLCLLAWLPASEHQRDINAVFPAGAAIPGWNKYWEFAFLGSKVLFVLVLIGAALLVLRRGADFPVWWFWRFSRLQSPLGGTGLESPVIRQTGMCALQSSESVKAPAASNALLITYALAFIVLLNATAALLDAAHVVPIYLMLAIRYVLVSAVAYAVILAGILERLEGLLRPIGKPRWVPLVSRLLPVLILAGLLVGMASSWSRWLVEKSSMESSLARLAKLAHDKGLDIICEDHQSAFYLAQRGRASNVKYVLAESFPFRSLMRRISEYYPQPAPISMAQFQQLTNDFVLLPNSQPPVIIHQPGGAPH
jgi:hypothetical protein